MRCKSCFLFLLYSMHLSAQKQYCSQARQHVVLWLLSHWSGRITWLGPAKSQRGTPWQFVYGTVHLLKSYTNGLTSDSEVQYSIKYNGNRIPDLWICVRRAAFIGFRPSRLLHMMIRRCSLFTKATVHQSDPYNQAL